MGQFGYVRPRRPALKRVVPCGDSITKGSPDPGGNYRAELDVLLNQTFNTVFVGSQTGGGDPGSHKGYPNAFISQFAPGASAICAVSWAAEFAAWSPDHDPDLFLVYLGTNGLHPELMVADVVDPILAANTTTKILIANLFPSALDDHKAFNSDLNGFITAHASFGTRVFLDREMSTALGLGDLIDGLHPTFAGAILMANEWYRSIVAQGLLA